MNDIYQFIVFNWIGILTAWFFVSLGVAISFGSYMRYRDGNAADE